MHQISNYSKEIDKLISNFNYSDYKSMYEIALKISEFSWEIALKIMINIIIADPLYFDEKIRDSIYLYIDAEGNRTTYNFIKKCISKNQKEDINEYLHEILDTLEQKYIKRGLIINLDNI